MVFSGCFCDLWPRLLPCHCHRHGHGDGKIAALLKSTEEKETPLQVSLNQFGKKLSIGI